MCRICFKEVSSFNVLYLNFNLFLVKPDLAFNISEGPHEVGKWIHMDCIFQKTDQNSTLSTLDITIIRGNRVIYVSTNTSALNGESQTVVHGSIAASLSFNRGVAICHATTESGSSLNESVPLRVYSRYQRVAITCDLFETLEICFNYILNF